MLQVTLSPFNFNQTVHKNTFSTRVVDSAWPFQARAVQQRSLSPGPRASPAAAPPKVRTSPGWLMMNDVGTLWELNIALENDYVEWESPL